MRNASPTPLHQTLRTHAGALSFPFSKLASPTMYLVSLVNVCLFTILTLHFSRQLRGFSIISTRYHDRTSLPLILTSPLQISTGVRHITTPSIGTTSSQKIFLDPLPYLLSSNTTQDSSYPNIFVSLYQEHIICSL